MIATINGLIVLCAGTIAAYLAGRRVFVLVQRWLHGHRAGRPALVWPPKAAG